MKVKKIKTHIDFLEFDLNNLTLGEIIVHDIFIKRAGNYVIIIEAGTVLSELLLKRLQNQDALYICESDSDKATLTDVSLLTYIQFNRHSPRKILEFIYRVNNVIFEAFLNSKDDHIDIKALQNISNALIYLVQANKYYLRDSIPHLSDEYALPYHSIHVAIYAINIGNFLQFSNAELAELALAGLLHDTGSKIYEASIKTKNDALDLKEIELVQQHPKLSTQIAKKNHVHDPYILDAIMHHHESYDGSGYPNKLQSNDISKLASILCISDVFDALTNKRVHREGYSSFEALKLMLHDESMADKFNTRYLKVFLRSLTDK